MTEFSGIPAYTPKMQAAQQAEVLLKDMAMDPMPEPLWLHSRWERGGRYYELRVKQDLFGDWLLARVWGRKGSALGQIRHAVCADQAEAHCRYAEAEVRRVKRGYQLRCQPNS